MSLTFFACNLPNQTGEIYNVSSNIQSLSNRPNIFINDNGDGLIIWENKARRLNKLSILHKDLKLKNEFDKSDLYINNIGDGFIVALSPDEVSIGKPSPKLVSIYKIKNFEPIYEPLLTLSDYFNDVKVNIDSNNNGIIILYKGKNISYINILNSELSNVKSYEKKTDNSFIYVKDNIISELKLDSNHQPIYINVDKEGNGYYTFKNIINNNYYLNALKNYNLSDEQMLLNHLYGEKELSLNQNGDGFSVEKVNNSDNNLEIYSIKSYTYKGISSVSNTYKNMYPQIMINKNNIGLLIWYEISNNSKILKAKKLF